MRGNAPLKSSRPFHLSYEAIPLCFTLPSRTQLATVSSTVSKVQVLLSRHPTGLGVGATSSQLSRRSPQEFHNSPHKTAFTGFPDIMAEVKGPTHAGPSPLRVRSARGRGVLAPGAHARPFAFPQHLSSIIKMPKASTELDGKSQNKCFPLHFKRTSWENIFLHPVSRGKCDFRGHFIVHNRILKGIWFCLVYYDCISPALSGVSCDYLDKTDEGRWLARELWRLCPGKDLTCHPGLLPSYFT